MHIDPALPYVVATLLAILFESMRHLRLVDDTIYLRSASINIFNGLISLTFSCDGSHYMLWCKFLDKDISIWTGNAA